VALIVQRNSLQLAKTEE